jgi:hypothetical protein
LAIGGWIGHSAIPPSIRTLGFKVQSSKFKVQSSRAQTCQRKRALRLTLNFEP